MGWLVIIVILIIIIATSKRKKPSNKANNKVYPVQQAQAYYQQEIKTYYQYEKNQILTSNETGFFAELKRIASNYNIDVLTKVRLCDIIKVKSGVDNSTYTSAFNTIKSKHIDFVLIDKNTNVVCCIELDDKSHEKEKAKANDEVKNKALLSAGVPLIRTKSAMGIEISIQEILSQSHL